MPQAVKTATRKQPLNIFSLSSFFLTIELRRKPRFANRGPSMCQVDIKLELHENEYLQASCDRFYRKGIKTSPAFLRDAFGLPAGRLRILRVKVSVFY
jgi:hypothetical protein